ncbi:toll-like receptor 13 [Anoplophora glabripennis]|nr:toll-like receptor 13 [Anoplophora glabripennis]
MAIRKILVLLSCILACAKLSYQIPPEPSSTNKITCTEDTEREYLGRRYYCRNSYCGYYQSVISKTISCNNISSNDLKSYEEQEEDFPFSYPLTLYVVNSEVPELATSTFKNLKNLTTLYMENVKLKTIMPAAFNYLERLKEIYLGQNELTTISDGIFNTLATLDKLDLSRNRIETVTNHAFSGVSLRTLYLKHNNISNLGEVLLSSLKSLSVLDVSYNNLSNITSFHGLKVQSLNLSHNQIEIVDFEMIQETPIIDFSFNNISKTTGFNASKANTVILSHNRINNFEKNDNVNVLDISYNSIQTLGSDLLSKSLTEIYLSFNLISSFNVDTFFGLYNLKHLYLDNNNLSSVPNSCFKDLNSLTHLNLSGNKLTYFKFGTLDNLVNLQVLDISKNNFKAIPQFHSLSELTHLFIQNNEISDVNTFVIYEQLPHLREINLINNTWSCQKLVNIVYKLKRKNIFISKGNFLDESNIYGIKCHETSENSSVNISKSEINLDYSKLNSFFNEDFTKTLLYKYFNQDFKETEFFKYLESLKKSINSNYTQNVDYSALNKKLLHEVTSNSNDMKVDIKNSEMYNYLNTDFKNTSFFKYFENFRLNTNKTEKLDEGKLEEIASSFKSIARELEKISNTNKSTEYFGKTDMFNYLNKDFKTSNFYRYLENLNAKNIEKTRYDDISDSTIEKLIGPYEKITEFPNYTGLLSVIVIALLIIICIMVTIAYHQFFHLNKFALKKEEVELI